MRHKATDLGAGWLADETLMRRLWNKTLEFDVEIKNISFFKFTKKVRYLVFLSLLQSLAFIEFKIMSDD